MIIVRLEGNTVAEIFPKETYEKGIAYWYNEEYAKQSVEAPDYVQQRWVYDRITKTFSEPQDIPFVDVDRDTLIDALLILLGGKDDELDTIGG